MKLTEPDSLDPASQSGNTLCSALEHSVVLLGRNDTLQVATLRSLQLYSRYTNFPRMYAFHVNRNCAFSA
jgi:hypothetical protein